MTLTTIALTALATTAILVIIHELWHHFHGSDRR